MPRDDARPGDQLRLESGTHRRVPKPVPGREEWHSSNRIRSAEEDLAGRLYTAGLPDPDLLIRTAGERRLSNYLLWQISYAEIHISDVNWPDFDEGCLNQAIDDYAGRTRRFGGCAREAVWILKKHAPECSKKGFLSESCRHPASLSYLIERTRLGLVGLECPSGYKRGLSKGTRRAIRTTRSTRTVCITGEPPGRDVRRNAGRSSKEQVLVNTKERRHRHGFALPRGLSLMSLMVLICCRGPVKPSGHAGPRTV